MGGLSHGDGAKNRRSPPLLQDLSQALSRNQFELWYQPQYTAPGHTLCGFEALLRWRHPQHGILLPGVFCRCWKKPD